MLIQYHYLCIQIKGSEQQEAKSNCSQKLFAVVNPTEKMNSVYFKCYIVLSRSLGKQELAPVIVCQHLIMQPQNTSANQHRSTFGTNVKSQFYSKIGALTKFSVVWGTHRDVCQHLLDQWKIS